MYRRTKRSCKKRGKKQGNQKQRGNKKAKTEPGMNAELIEAAASASAIWKEEESVTGCQSALFNEADAESRSAAEEKESKRSPL